MHLSQEIDETFLNIWLFKCYCAETHSCNRCGLETALKTNWSRMIGAYECVSAVITGKFKQKIFTIKMWNIM